MNRRKILSKLNSIALVTAICVQTVGTPLMVQATEPTSASQSATTQKVFGAVNGTYDQTTDQEVISLEAKSPSSEVRIQYIMMPDGSKVEGEKATFTAKYNGDFAFNVIYEEVRVIKNEAGEDVEYILNGQQTFKHTVSSILNGTTPSTGRDEFTKDEESKDESSESQGSQNQGSQSQTKDEVTNNYIEGELTNDYVGDTTSQEGEVTYTKMTGREYKALMGQNGNAEAFAIYMDYQAQDLGVAEMIADDDIMVISDDGITFNVSTKTITAYSLGANANSYAILTIPAQIDGVYVEHIGARAFYGKYITSIDFESGSKLKTIGSEAFRSAYINGSISLPSTVTSIGSYAFYASRITNVTVPGALTDLGTFAFASCTLLTSAVFTGSLSVVPVSAFASSAALSRVELPNTVTTISDSAFNGCTGLMTINFPATLTTIGVNAFNGCTSLMTVNLGSAMRTIGNSAFNGCTSLMTFTAAEGLTTLGNYAFQSTALYKVELPTTLTSVGQYAFQSCSSLVSVVLKGNVTAVGYRAFYNSANLKVVSFDKVANGTLSTSNWGASASVVYVWAGQVYEGNFILDTATGTVSRFIDDKLDTQEIPAEFVDGAGKSHKPLILADNLFLNNAVITDVVLPDSIQKIGYRTFYGCSKLATVNMPTELVEIGAQAFYGCLALSSVVTYDKLTTIGASAFFNCQAVSEIRLGNKVQTIGNSAFQQCYGIGNITIPDSVTSMGTNVFYACTKLKEVVIGTGITTLNNNAFGATATNVSSIELVTIKGKMTSISSSAFVNQIKIGQVYLTGVTEAQFNASGGGNKPWGATTATIVWSDTAYQDGFIFEKATGTITGYTGDESIISIPEEIDGIRVEHIGYRAFYQNADIAVLEIPDSVLTIASQAFYRCKKLKTITIGTGITSIGANAFAMEGTGTSYTLMESITIHGLTAANSSVATTAFTNFPVSTHYYFTGVTKAVAATKGWSAASSWGGAVTTLPSTTAPVIWGDTVYQDGFIFDKGEQTLRAYRGTEATVIIPEDFDGVEVKIIGTNAFRQNTTITEVRIPDSVVTIMPYAFYYTSKLARVEIGSGINSIGAYAFAMQSHNTSYTQLTEVVIHGLLGDSASIAGTAFQYHLSTVQYYFTQLTTAEGEAKIGANAKSWGSSYVGTITWAEIIRQDGFIYNLATGTITSCSLTTGAITIPDEFFRAYAHEKADTEIGYKPTVIGASVFSGKTGITSVYIPNSVVSLGTNAFHNCTELQSVTGGEGIKELGDYAFRYNYKLLNLPLFEGLETIGSYAFYRCHAVQNVSIPNTVRSIGSYAFAEMNTLQTVSISDSVTSIGTYAFYYNVQMKEVTIGTGLKTIPNYAFGYPNNNTSSYALQTVTFNGLVENISTNAFYRQYKLQEIILENNAENSVAGYENRWGGKSDAAIIWGKAIIEDGYVFNTANGTIVAYRGTESNVKIPSEFGGVTVTAIGSNAFINNKTMLELTIPDTVTTIGASAFSGCSALLKVTIEGDTDTPAITIGTSAFASCTSLLEMHIYGPVTSVAANALTSSNKLATMHFKHMDVNSVVGYASRWGSSYTAMTIGWADTVITDGFIFDSKTLTITGYVGTETELNVPTEFVSSLGASFTPEHIGASAFQSKTAITSIKMPDTIKTIGNKAFYGCNKMTVVILSENLESIGNEAFYNNSALIGITIPDSVTTIGDSAFRGATGMYNVIFGEGLQSIGIQSFYDCDNLTFLTFPESLRTVGSQAFGASALLEQVKFTGPLNENGMGAAAFTSCPKLEYVILSENEFNTVQGSTTWGMQAGAIILWKYYVLTDDFVFNGVTNTLIKYIGDDLEVTIPESFEIDGKDVPVKTIGENALLNNTKVMSLIIPDSVETIGANAFKGCTSLAQVSIGSGVTMIQESAFSGCTTLGKVELPESVRLIDKSVFSGCSTLTEIIIPGEIEVISSGVFSGCTQLEIIYLPKHTAATLPGSPWGAPSSTLTIVWSNLIYENGFVYDIATETIIRYVGSDATITIPEKFVKDGTEYNPTNIGAKVFQSKAFITRVVIPDTVEVIGEYAFQNNANLSQVAIGNGVTDIEQYAFEKAPKLAILTIGNSVKEIGAHAFNGATALKELTLPDSLENIATYAFNGLVNITDITIPNNVKYIGTYAFNGATKVMEITIGDSVVDIDTHAFNGASKLAEIHFGKSVANIRTSAFYGATNLSSLILPESIRNIEATAFGLANATGNILTDIVINGKITSIASNAFSNRSAVEMIFLPECDTDTVANKNWGLTNSDLLILWSNIVYQDGFVFDYNSGEVVTYRGKDTKVTIPDVFTKDGVDYKPTAIKASAFRYNGVIQSITVPATVKDVGTLAFANMGALKEVVFVGELNTIGASAFGTTPKLEVIYLPQNEKDSVTGSPWGASTSTVTILWSNYVLQDGFIFDIATSEVFKYIGSEDNVVVPSVFKKWVSQADGSLEEMTFKATKIADSAFVGNTIFKEVTIAEGITEIGNYAFSRGANTSHSTANTTLITVNFPTTLERIGYGTFRYCTGLVNAELPENLITIDPYAFAYASKYALKEIPDSVKTIGTYAFMNCLATVDLTIGDGVTVIGYGAFQTNSNLKNVTIGTGIKTIDDVAFNNCALLENVYINGDINSIGRSAFRYCGKIKTVHLPEKLTGSVANSNWNYYYVNSSNTSTSYAATPIVVWKDVILTDDYLFNITTGTITKYYGTTDVHLEVPKTFTKIVDGEEVVHVVKAIGPSVFANKTTLQTVKIPDSVTAIGASAFSGCSNLTEVIMEGKIDTIGSSAFSSTSKLKIISLQQNETGTVTGASWGANTTNANIIWSNNIYASDFIYDIDTKTVIKYIGSATDISIPSSFTKGDTTYSTDTLGVSLFYNKTAITKVTIPSSVTTIGNTVFSGCSNLQQVVMSDNVTTIGTSAFYNCQKLHTIKMPSALESLGVSAFQNCYALTEVVLGNNLATIPNNAFHSCYALTNIQMGTGVKTIGEYAFYNNNALTEVTLGTNVTAIGANAFNHSDNLRIVNIPSAISTIGSNAFANCPKMAEIHIPQKDSGTVTGANWGASTSTSVVVWRDTILTDEYIYSIASKTITKYRGTATNVTVPSTLTKDGVEYPVENIGASAFASNATLQKVTLPETLITVGDYAFASSPMLSEVIFSSEMSKIGYRAFYNLASIKVVVFPENFAGTVAGQSSWALSTNAVIVWKNLIYLDQFVYDIESKTVTKYLGTATTVVVPSIFEKDGEEYIPVHLGASIFQNKSTMVSVSLPEGMETIGVNAFRNMSKLKTVTLPSTLTTINNEAFRDSTALSQIKLPENLKIIEELAFYNCDGITEVTLPAGMERVGNSAFAYCDNILKVTLKGKINTLGTYIFRTNTKLNNLDIQSGVEVIGTAMFYDCDKLTKAILPNTVTTINDNAFGASAVLTQVFIPLSTVSISSSAFAGSNQMTKIYVDQFKTEGGEADGAINPLAKNQPWGANGYSNGTERGIVFWKGETVSFAHTIESVTGQNAIKINLTASLKPVLEGATKLEQIILPDAYGAAEKGETIAVTNGEWSGSFTALRNGTFTFTGVDSAGNKEIYEVEITTVGMPTIKAKDAYIEATDLEALTTDAEVKAKILEITQASVTDDSGKELPATLITFGETDDVSDLDAVKALSQHGESVMITLKYFYAEYNTSTEQNVVITLVKGKQIPITDHNKKPLGAYWMEYGVEVNSYAKDGSLVESVEILPTTTTVQLPEPAEIDGYTFSQWNLKQNEDQSVTATPVYLADEITIMFKDHESNDLSELELSVGSKIITYDKEGNALVPSYTIAHDDTMFQLGEPAEVTGYDFDKWVITKTSNGGATATPIYTIQSYKVSVEDMDGTEVGVFTVDYMSEVHIYNNVDSVIETHIITEATTITLGEPSVKDGYTFVSWAGLKEATGNVAIKPSYTINSYTITIKDNSNVVVGQPTVQFGKKITAVTESGSELYSEVVTSTMTEMKLPSAPEKEGYSCSNWEISINGDGSVVVKPVYKINSYKMVFRQEDGTDIRNQEHVFGEVLISPVAPSQEGKTFTAWNPTVPDTVPAKDTVFTAEYSNNLYALTFRDDEGVTISTSTVEFGGLITAPTPTKAGHVFTGWVPQLIAKMPAADQEFTATFRAGTGYSITFTRPDGNVDTTRVMDTGDSVEVRGAAGELLNKYDITGDLNIQLPNLYKEGEYVKEWNYLETESGYTVTPVFAKNTYDIKFVMPNGTVVEELLAQEYGSALKAPANPTLEGHSFIAWSPTVPSTVQGANATYTAQFTKNTYTVRFLDKDGGLLSQSSVEYGATIQEPDNIPSVSGHTFIGWSPALPSAMPAENLELTAQYKGGVFDKTINIFSSTGELVGTVAVNVGDTISVKNHADVVYNNITITEATGTRIDLDPATFKPGYTFAEWSMTVDANGHYTLTPMYEEEKYTATFYDANGNVIGTAQELKFGEVIKVPAASEVPVVPDMKFSGWLPVVPATMPNNNMNFVAQYTDADTHRVTITAEGKLISDINVKDGAVITIKNGTDVKEVAITGNQEIRLDAAAKKEGYNYDTWQVIDNGDNTYTVEPLYTLGSYTMTFMANGVIHHAVTANYGDKLNAPVDPISTENGKMFAGWSPIVPSTVPGIDTLFTAQFSDKSGVLVDVKDFEGNVLKQIIFKVGAQLEVYDQNGVELARRTINANTSELTLPEVPTITGYTFTGWEIKELSAGNVTASMTYKINKHTLRFEGMDGTTISENEVEFGITITEPDDSDIPVIANKTFAGWKPALLTNMPDEDVTFTATYVDGNLNIIRVYDFAGKLLETLNLEDNVKVYIVNEFGNEITTQTVNGDGSIYLPEVPDKTGYDPQDWIITVDANGNATIKRDYSKQVYTIIFRDEDGTILSEEEYEFGDTVIQPTFPTSGGVFGGWNPDFKAVAEGDVTYYAQYSTASNAVTVNFYDHNGVFVGTKAMNTGSEVVIVDSNDKAYPTETISATSGSIDITLPELDLSDLDNAEDFELGHWELIQNEPGEFVTATAIIIEKGNMLTFLDSEGEVIQEGLRAPDRIINPPSVNNIPVIPGKTFSGWTPTLADIMPDIALTYTATYVNGEYKVITIKDTNGAVLEYMLVNDGEELIFKDEDGNEVSSQVIDANTEIQLTVQADKEGHSAEGYDITQDRRGDAVEIQSNYKVLSYTLRFEEADGTLISEQDVDFGTDLTTIIPADPTKAGWTFTGWDPKISGTMPSNDVTYTGTFIQGNFHSVDIIDHQGVLRTTLAIAEGESVDIIGEDGTVLESHVITDVVTSRFFGLVKTGGLIEEITLPTPATIENLTFIDWDIEQANHGDSATITTRYEGGPFDVAFYDEDGTTQLGGGTYAYASDMDVPVDPQKEGYSFTGWENQNTNEILGANIRVPNKNTVYKATYAINQYTITFEDEDGNPVGGALASQELDFAEAFEVPATPDKLGYVLDKWVVKDSNPEEVLDMNNLVVPAKDVTYVLNYKLDSYKVTYYANEKAEGVENDVHEEFTVEYTTPMPAPSTLPEKDGYRFIQWSPVPDATVPAKNTEYWPIFEEGTGNVVTIFDHNDKEFGSKIVAVGGSIIVYDSEGEVAHTIVIGDDTTTAKLPEPTAPEGYSYDSWIIEQERPDADVIVKPQFTINSYKVTFADRDGNEYPEDEYNLEQEYATAITVPAHKPISGYTFDGWLDKDGNEIIQSANPTVPAKDTKYNAVYTAINYPVTFTDEDGNAYPEDEYNLTSAYETNIAIPAGKDKVGHTFVGWDNGSDVINVGDTVKVPLNGITYKAKYDVNQYDMVFYANEQDTGLTDVHETLSLDYNSAMQVPTTTPPKANHTFVGWEPTLPATVPANTLEFWPTYVFGVGESIKVTDQDGAPFDKGYIMVSAGNKVIINKDANGNNQEVIVVVEGQDDIQLPAPSVANGYAFDRWEASQPDVGGDITFTPVYTLRSYTMTFVDIDGNAYPEDEYTLTQEYTSEIVVPAGKPVVGYDFAGWVATDNVVIQPGDTGITMPAKNVTYTASYNIRNIEVKYYDVANVVIDDYTINRDYNTSFTIPNGPDYEGHTFIGWSIKTAPGDWDDTKLLQVGDTLLAPPTDVEFQAEYEVNQYKVRFEDFNNSLVSEESQDYATAITAPADRSREGYTFTGWENVVTGEKLDDGVTTVPSKNVTYIATYAINTYKITYYSEADGSAVHYEADVEYKDAVVRPNVDPIKVGHTFMGWTPSIPVTMPAQDVEIFPIFVEGIQDIIKISDHTGKLVQSVIIDAGETVTVKYSADKEFTYNITNGYPDIQLDEPPAVKGHVFTGWFLEQAADGGSVVLTPKYAKESYTIKFVNYDGELYGGADSVQVLEYGSAVVRPADPVRSGYTFTGWTPVFSAVAEADVIYTATYKEGDGLSITLFDQNDVLVGTYAMAIGNKFDQYDNDGKVVQTVVIKEGDSSVKLKDPEVIPGFDFQRWEVEQAANGNVVIKPLYFGSKNNIKVTDADGKTLADVVMVVGTSVYQLNMNGEIIATIPILPNTTEVKAAKVEEEEGHTFTGEWNVTKDEEGNYTIAPRYSVNTYTIMFVDHDNWIMQEEELKYDTNVIAPSEPIRAGYTFIGWSPALQDKVPAKDVIYKAVYEEKVVTNPDTGSGNGSGDGSDDGSDDGSGDGSGDVTTPGTGGTVNNNYYNGSSTPGVPGAPGAPGAPGVSGGEFTMPEAFEGDMILPGIGDITIDGATFNNSNNAQGGSNTDRTNNGFLNTPVTQLHLYHIVFIASGLLGFVLMFKKRRLDDEYGDELFLRRLNKNS